MVSMFMKGGPAMWPLLIVSIAAMTTVIERSLFVWRQKKKQQPELVRTLLRRAEAGKLDEAIFLGRHARDPVARILVYGLLHRDRALSGALLHSASKELKPFQKGLTVLDTTVTLSPLLGLFGTVTGMIRAFGLLGGQEMDAPAAITGGIAEALIATAFGLCIAILALVPLNLLNSYYERTKEEMEQAATELEVLLHEDPVHIS
ncbi:MAG: MotA/TolQ/ExbB proton channel family protein [Candidatus Omnitrophota bacterium]|nr:MotA/TolQ/ExbB proton channel family protein [Candidatus Omnitrophota bacterium]